MLFVAILYSIFSRIVSLFDSTDICGKKEESPEFELYLLNLTASTFFRAKDVNAFHIIEKTGQDPIICVSTKMRKTPDSEDIRY